MAKLPTVVSVIPADLRQFINRVREALTGIGPDAIVTKKDLTSSGLAVLGSGGSLILPTTLTVSNPSTPENVSAAGALATVILSWKSPSYLGHSYAEIWASSTTLIGDAVLVGMAAGTNFSHSIGAAATRHYWVRFVNKVSLAGPYHGTVGIVGTTGNDPSYLLAVLADEITASELHSDLTTRINLIDGSSSLTGSVSARVLSEQTARLAAALTEHNARLAADATINAAVTAEETSRQTADSATTSQLNVAVSQFQLNGASIASEATTRATADSSTASQVTAIVATQGANTSAITAEETARVNADAASAVVTNGLAANFATNAAGISSEASARTAADSSTASQVTALVATQGTNAAAITSEATARTTADGTHAGQINTLQTTSGGHTTSIQTTTSATNGIQAKHTVKIDNSGHISGYGLISTANDATPTAEFGVRADNFWVAPPAIVSATEPSSGLYKGYVWVNTATPAVTKYYNGTAFVTTPQSFPLVVKTGSGTVNGVTVPAGVYMDTAMIADATITNAKIGSLTADKITASLLNTVDFYSNTIAGADIHLGGTVVYETDADGNNVGIASVTNPTVSMYGNGLGAFFDVERFRIRNGAGAGTTAPFRVVGGITVINEAQIEDGTISNAKIGSYIQSTDYNSATDTGWKINKDGTADFNSATLTAGALQSPDGNFVIDLTNGTITISV